MSEATNFSTISFTLESTVYNSTYRHIRITHQQIKDFQFFILIMIMSPPGQDNQS